MAGESAGGNLAVAVSMMARDDGIRKPLHAVAVYPVASNDPNTASKLQYTDANPLISLVNGNLSGLPPTTIIGAEIDPLQSEGKTLADKLTAAGCKENL